MQGTERTLEKRNGLSVAGHAHLPRKEWLLRTKCERVISLVFSTALNVSVNWPPEYGKSDESQAVRIKDLEFDVQAWDEGRRGMGRTQEAVLVGDESHMEQDEITDDGCDER